MAAPQVHWYEGLFLQPHHLQTMQRYLLGQISSERDLAWPYPYGVVEAKLSADSLKNMVVQFERLRVVMPSGLEVRFPDNAELIPLNIRAAFHAGAESVDVHLAVPLWRAEKANAAGSKTSSGPDDHRLYRLIEGRVKDENTGDNEQPILMRSIDARLMVGQAASKYVETLPLLRIRQPSVEDLEFIPPCLTISGSHVLYNMVRDLADQVAASRKDLLRQLATSEFRADAMRGEQLEQILRLRTLNRYAAVLPELIRASRVARNDRLSSITPFEVYLQFRSLLGELAALDPKDDQFEVAEYHHDNLIVPFSELDRKLRNLLSIGTKVRSKKLDFVRDGRAHLVTVADEHLNSAIDFFLGIRTNQDPNAVVRIVENPDAFKFMAKESVFKHVSGVPLKKEHYLPLGLPVQAGLHFFRLQRDPSRMWNEIKVEKSIGVTWPDVETSDFVLTLYILLPE